MFIDAVVTPLSFLKTFVSGRRQPVLTRCRADYPDGSTAFVDLVLKPLRPDFPEVRVESEVLCSMLASALGLPTPDAYLVELDEELLATWPRAQGEAGELGLRPGLAFGSVFMEGALPVSRAGAQAGPPFVEQALRLLVFDGLVVNRDRSVMNPNCLLVRNVLYAIDHEACLGSDGAAAPEELPALMAYHVSRQFLRSTGVSADAVDAEVAHVRATHENLMLTLVQASSLPVLGTRCRDVAAERIAWLKDDSVPIHELFRTLVQAR